MAQDIWPAAIL